MAEFRINPADRRDDVISVKIILSPTNATFILPVAYSEIVKPGTFVVIDDADQIIHTGIYEKPEPPHHPVVAELLKAEPVPGEPGSFADMFGLLTQPPAPEKAARYAVIVLRWAANNIENREVYGSAMVWLDDQADEIEALLPKPNPTEPT